MVRTGGIQAPKILLLLQQASLIKTALLAIVLPSLTGTDMEMGMETAMEMVTQMGNGHR